jgi:putative Mg2+ transporter-C (MgtC) family protein
MQFEWHDLIRLLFACVAGALVGLERELRHKPAGLRTNVMICLGAALFTVLSLRIAASNASHDPGRIAAQVVTGVGFLGAGAILHARGSVVGLTTAAGIWLVASIGVAFGAGALVLGWVVTVLSLGVLSGLGIVEDRLVRWRTTAKFQIEMEPSPDLSRNIKQHLRELDLPRRTWRVSKVHGSFSGFLVTIGPESRLEELQNRIMAEPGVTSLVRL